jgi:hypothetical protein
MTSREAYQKALTAQKRLPELEPIILQDEHYSYFYVDAIIKGRWEEGEEIIATTAYIAYCYATSIIKGRWEKGETAIAKDLDCAFLYETNVLKWNAKYISFYILAIGYLWNYLPEELKNDPDIMTAYFKEILK